MNQDALPGRDGGSDRPEVCTDPFPSDPADAAYVLARLRSQNYLTDPEYSSVLSSLTERSAVEGRALSALHVLEHYSFRNFSDMLAFISCDSNTPLIELSRFEPRREAYMQLNADFMARNSVLCFDRLDTALMTALLNPYDKKLQSEVAAMTGREHIFYVCLASDFDCMLNRIVESTRGEDGSGAAPGS